MFSINFRMASFGILLVSTLDPDGERRGFTNHIRNLNFQAVCDARGHQVLGDISAHVCGAAVNLSGVFAGECAAAVAGDAAVSPPVVCVP